MFFFKCSQNRKQISIYFHSCCSIVIGLWAMLEGDHFCPFWLLFLLLLPHLDFWNMSSCNSFVFTTAAFASIIKSCSHIQIISDVEVFPHFNSISTCTNSVYFHFQLLKVGCFRFQIQLFLLLFTHASRSTSIHFVLPLPLRKNCLQHLCFQLPLLNLWGRQPKTLLWLNLMNLYIFVRFCCSLLVIPTDWHTFSLS